MTWGNGSRGVLGTGSGNAAWLVAVRLMRPTCADANSATPKAVESIASKVVSVAASAVHTVILTGAR